MKKILIILFAAFISEAAYSQKVKIDKKTGIMSIDKVDVAKLSTTDDAEKHHVYTFTDLKLNDSVTLTEIPVKTEGEQNFFKVTSSLSDKTSEMGFELVKFTFNMNSAVASLIVSKYNFFTTEGINKDAIVQFLNLENNKFSLALKEKEEMKAKEQQEAEARKKEMEARLAPYNLRFISNDLKVTNKNTDKTVVTLEDPSGYSMMKDYLNTNFVNFGIKSVEGDKLAIVRSKKGKDITPDYFIQTYDNQIYPLNVLGTIDIPIAATEVLIANGYIGDGEKSPEHIRQLAAAKKKAREEEYNRRTHVDGVLVLKNGEELKGQFSTEFRETPDGMVSPAEPGIVSLSGKTITYFYKDEKGKDKGRFYKEKEIRSFRVLKEGDPNYDEYYCTIDYYILPKNVINDGSLDVMRLGKNLLNRNKPQQKSALVYRAVDTPKVTLYFSEDKIFVTDKKNAKTVLLDSEQYETQLKEIAADCQSVTANIESHKYGLNRDSMLGFVTDYNECK